MAGRPLGGLLARRHAALGRAFLAKYAASRDPIYERQAAEHCRSALELDPRSPEVLLTLAARLQRQLVGIAQDQENLLRGEILAAAHRAAGAHREAQIVQRIDQHVGRLGRIEGAARVETAQRP